MADSLNDFIHAGAAAMFEDNSMREKQDYSYYEGRLRQWVEFLLLNDVDNISSIGWVLRRVDEGDRVHYELDRHRLSYHIYENDPELNHSVNF